MASELFDKFRFGQATGGRTNAASPGSALPVPTSAPLQAAAGGDASFGTPPVTGTVGVGTTTSTSSSHAQSGSGLVSSPFGSIFIPPSLLAADPNSNAPKMDDATFKKFRDFIYEQCGISFTENKKYLLEGRVGKRLEAYNMQTFDEYYKMILSGSAVAREEMPNLFEVVTINETYFFRNPPQFEALEQVILPEILKAKQAQGIKKLRIWSAASSSGEEAYTMSMMILERIKPQFPGFQFEIVGTDINTAVLEKARQGVYKEYSVRNMPAHYLNKYFTREGDKYILSPEVRSQVKFLCVNLYDTPTMRTINSFDVVFCCNVLIYFDTPAKQQVVANLYDALQKGGYLFIGYSESLHGVSKAFKLVHFPKTIAYKKD
jgi:chemotaxis protein methyltransferase CheR